MITFSTQEGFENAVMAVLCKRVCVGVAVSKERMFYETPAQTKVEVSLFDNGGDDIARGSGYA